MKFWLTAREGRSDITAFATHLTDEILSRSGEIVKEDETPDMVLAVGGDGTMLGAVSRAISWDVPVLGFNMGTLGFLTAAEPSQVEIVLDRLFDGDFDTADRLTVSASVGDSQATGVNDVVVEKVDTTRLVSLAVVIDGAHLATYRADGIIVATPTGSTAYSFSAGGPVVDPRVEALVLTPVASHSLFDRPLVLPATSRIEIQVTRDRPVRVNVDKTDLGTVGEDERVVITAGERPARFVTLESMSFPTLLRDKFHLD